MKAVRINRFVALYLLLPAAAAGLFVSCKKSAGGTVQVLATNASVSAGSLLMTWSGTKLSATALAQGQTTGSAAAPYISLPAGTNTFSMQSGSNTVNKNIYGAAGGHYSLLAYDTGASSAMPRVLLLTDVLTLPDTAHAGLRFINCSPDTTINLYLVNSVSDTLAITGSKFIGAAAEPSSLQLFGAAPHGTYKPYVYKAGTASSPLLAADSITLAPQKIYTMIYSGLKSRTGADSLKLRLIAHPTQ